MMKVGGTRELMQSLEAKLAASITLEVKRFMDFYFLVHYANFSPCLGIGPRAGRGGMISLSSSEEAQERAQPPTLKPSPPQKKEKAMAIFLPLGFVVGKIHHQEII